MFLEQNLNTFRFSEANILKCESDTIRVSGAVALKTGRNFEKVTSTLPLALLKSGSYAAPKTDCLVT